MDSKKKLDYNLRWDDYLKLEDSSPSGLVWINRSRNIFTENQPAGSKKFRKNGDARAWSIGFQGKDYYVHRIIWILINGYIDPELVIDHLNGNPFNNRVDNLSLKTLGGNQKNRFQQSSNTTGVTGVSRINNGRDCWYYVAHWYECNGFRKSKYFSIFKTRGRNC